MGRQPLVGHVKCRVSGLCPHLFADLRLVTGWQHLKVAFQRTGLDTAPVEVLIQRAAKQDVLLQGVILNPGLLRHVRHTALRFTRRGWVDLIINFFC